MHIVGWCWPYLIECLGASPEKHWIGIDNTCNSMHISTNFNVDRITFLCTCGQISISSRLAGNQCTLGRASSEMSSTPQLLVQHYCSYLCPVIQGNVAQLVLHTPALRWLHARKHWQETSKSLGQLHLHCFSSTNQFVFRWGQFCSLPKKFPNSNKLCTLT